jgi:hypothetical protein
MLAALLACAPVSCVAQEIATPASPKGPAKKGEKSAQKEKNGFHEAWDAIGLDGSVMMSYKPVPGDRSDIAGNIFIRELYQLAWRPSDPMDVYVVRPRGVEKPPVIIYLYSFPQDTDRFKNDHWCTAATVNGYAAVGMVSAFTGHRLEHRAPKEWFVSELQESLAESTHDIQMILNYLETRGDVDMTRVGILGQGSGGAIAILASGADARIRALDVLTPWGDWPTWLAKSKMVPDDERAKYLTPEFLAKVATMEPTKWLPKVKARNVRIQNVRKDGNVPDEVQEKMESASPDIAEINQYADGRALVPAASGGRLLDWLKDELRLDAKPAVAAAATERTHFFATKKDVIQ